MADTLPLNTTVVLTPLRTALGTGLDTVVDVLVRIQAPDAPQGHAARRPPQALALVIDRSGSMAGRPLTEARRCAEYVLGMLRPTDAMALVQFDNRVQRLWPAVQVGDGAPQRAAIAGIRPGGNTALHDGWKDGADALSEVEGSGLKRVILLSDGQANEGLTDPDAIAAQCAQWAERGVSTSTYGLGQGFNEELMVAMARAGGGNHYYGETAEDLMEPFGQELELLGNLCMRELRLSAEAPAGVGLRMLNELPAIGGGWRMPDLAWSAEAWAVLRLTVPAGALPPQGRLLTVLRVAVTGRTLRGEAVALERAGLALPVVSQAAFGTLPEDEMVARRLVELAAADVLSQMRMAALQDDWAQVDGLLAQAQARFASHDWVAAMLRAMSALAASRSRERVGKEALYSTHRLHHRLTAHDERADLGSAQQIAQTPAFLRRKPQQGRGQS